MSLLYPLMALGMIAAAVPIWLHLRRRDEKNLVEFSTLRFLDDQPLARARPLWPRNWPLLMLRLMGLLLLVAAFTWPYAASEDTVVVEESRVYILDNTLSHQVDDGFSNARDQVAAELAVQNVRTQIGVVELSNTARAIVRFGDDKGSAAETVRRLQPSSARGEFIDAFRTAGEMLATSLGAKRRIVLLSDSQANQWTHDGNSPPFLEDVDVDLPAASETPPVNLSLSEPRARRVVHQGRHWIEASVLLARQGTRVPPEIVFWTQGREVARVQVNPSETEANATEIVSARWQCDPTTWAVAEATIESDVDTLQGDNRVVFSLPPQRLGRIELLAESLYLRRALAPEVMSGRWDVQVADADRLADRHSASAPDVLCLESQSLLSAGVRNTVIDDLSAGRGVMMFVDQSTPLIAGFLRDLGIDLESSPHAPEASATFRYVFAEHPIFSPFRSTDIGNLADIEFTNYRKMKVRDAMSLAFSAAGAPLIFEVNAGPGRMLVFAFACERRDTNWPIHPTFIPFLDQSLNYVRGEPITDTAYQPGESVVLDLPPSTNVGEATVTPLDPATMGTPDGPSDPIIVDVRDGKVSFQLPVEVGHYAVRSGDDNRIAIVLDVNPSPLESELTYEAEPTAVSAWQRLRDDGDDNPSANQTSRIELSRLEALQQPYWWYFLIASVVVFLVETVYSTRLQRNA